MPEYKVIRLTNEEAVKIKGLMRTKGFSQTYIGRQLGTSQATVSDYINGKAPMPYMFAGELYRLLNKNPDVAFLTREPETITGAHPPTSTAYRNLTRAREGSLGMDVRWKNLVGGYSEELVDICMSLEEDKRPELAKDILSLLKKYRPQSPTQ